MSKGRMTFTQLTDFASQDLFKVCVYGYNGNYKAKEFTCLKQFFCMAFGQLNQHQSMSDTLLCLKLTLINFTIRVLERPLINQHYLVQMKIGIGGFIRIM
jgi:hypothetical protein